MRTLMTVEVEVDGKWPTDKEIENRNAVISELSEQNLGKFIKAGSGMRSMHFAYEVHDEKLARSLMAKTLFKHLPGYDRTFNSKAISITKDFAKSSGAEKPQQKQQSGVQQSLGMGM